MDINERVSHKDSTIIYGDSSVDANKVSAIWVLTTDQGPLSDDVALVLVFDGLKIVIPSEHPDHWPILHSLSKDFAVDFKVYINAMSCADNAKFILWESTERA